MVSGALEPCAAYPFRQTVSRPNTQLLTDLHVLAHHVHLRRAKLDQLSSWPPG
ncbi:hypothetical protein ACLMNJ_32730 [Streptomyces seoulensis]